MAEVIEHRKFFRPCCVSLGIRDVDVGNLLNPHQTAGILPITAVTRHAVECLKLALGVFRGVVLLQSAGDLSRVRLLQCREIGREMRCFFTLALGCQTTTLW